ncbi:MAG: hypothetical protein LPK03_12065 [Pontibacter sp.]|nr:hypothetical protein [Pontibacter sp.]
MKNTLLLLLVLLGLLTACEDKYKDPDPKLMGYEYFPLEVGSYRIYNVTDIRFKSDVGDTTRFQMRERVDTTFTDQTGALNYKIIRSIRANENSAWEDDSVMTAVRSVNNLILMQNNTKYVKMVFPVKEGKHWIGDAYNDRVASDYAVNERDGKELYTYRNVGENYYLNGNTFPNTVEIIQGDYTSDDFVVDKRKEVYAEEIGRIYRQFTKIIFSPCSPQDCKYGEDYKIYGHERHEELIAHGKE